MIIPLVEKAHPCVSQYLRHFLC